MVQPLPGQIRFKLECSLSVPFANKGAAVVIQLVPAQILSKLKCSLYVPFANKYRTVVQPLPDHIHSKLECSLYVSFANKGAAVGAAVLTMGQQSMLLGMLRMRYDRSSPVLLYKMSRRVYATEIRVCCLFYIYS